jgi:ABC-2 type transport system permease protein
LRMLGFLAATIAYGGVWLAIAVLFSVVFRAPATAALAALGLWLLFTFFWSLMVTPLVSTLIAGPSEGMFGPNLAYVQTQQILDRLSPTTLYTEAAQALLQPEKRFFGFVYLSQLVGALPTPLPTLQSFFLVWPQLTGLVAAMIVIFAVAYIAFQRQEIRA